MFLHRTLTRSSTDGTAIPIFYVRGQLLLNLNLCRLHSRASVLFFLGAFTLPIFASLLSQYLSLLLCGSYHLSSYCRSYCESFPVKTNTAIKIHLRHVVSFRNRQISSSSLLASSPICAVVSNLNATQLPFHNKVIHSACSLTQ